MIIYHDGGSIAGWQIFPKTAIDGMGDYIEIETPQDIETIPALLQGKKVSGGALVDKSQSELDAEAQSEALEAVQAARRAEYPPLNEQLDMQYWDAVNGTSIWRDTIDAIKAAHPKPGAASA